MSLATTAVTSGSRPRITLDRTISAKCRSKGEGRISAIINDGSVDRYNTVILPSGARWDGYLRSGPAVLWEHGKDPTRGRVPVAKCTEIRQTSKHLEADMTFSKDDFSRVLYEKYRDGELRSFSVEFHPDRDGMSRPTRDEVRANPSWAGAEVVYRSWELTGFSAVSYPGNTNACVTDVRSSMGKGSEFDRLVGALTGIISRCYDESPIWKEHRRWVSLIMSGMTPEQIERSDLADRQRKEDADWQLLRDYAYKSGAIRDPKLQKLLEGR